MKKTTAFLLFLGMGYLLSAQNILGQWNGVLDVRGSKLRIVFHISEADGGIKATMDSPDQKATGIPTDEATFEGSTLTIKASALGMTYTGELSEDGATLEGTFKQGPMSLPLEMTREEIEKPKAPNRPQEPKDFPYGQEEVKFENPKGGHTLAGTLTMPSDGKFDKVAVLVTGSGPQDRNEEILGHKTFLVLSDHFTREGIAVLRYDDRGVGESTGIFQEATSRDFADDAAAAVAYLRSRPDMDGKQIGIVGHSEGGMIAPIVASEDKDLGFIVLLAGPGQEIDKLMILQSNALQRAQKVSEEMIQSNSAVLKEMYTFIRANPSMEHEKLKSSLEDILREGLNKFSEEDKADLKDEDAFIASQLKIVTSDWFLYFLRFSPADYLSKVSCPVLAINGELDLQVLPKENLAGIEESLKHNTNVTIKEFPKLNHLFQTAETGAPSEYGQIEETFNEEAMSFVSNWILTYHQP